MTRCFLRPSVVVAAVCITAALCFAALPAATYAQSPYAFGSVFVPNAGYYQNPGYSYQSSYSGYGYQSNYGGGYYPRSYGSYQQPYRSNYRSYGGYRPSHSYSVPTYGGPIHVQHLGLPGLQNVITLPPGATVQSVW